jgi:hypothetical protein
VKRARWLAAALGAVPALALAQSPPNLLSQRLYVDPGALLGSPRMVALGGAYVAVAEGADGMSANLAAITQHAPGLDRPWDVDATVSWLNIGAAHAQQLDYDNAGSANGAESSAQLAAAALVQFVHFGLGTSFRYSRDVYCTTDCSSASALEVQWVKATVAASMALHHDDLLVALGYFGINAGFSYQGQTWQYSGSGVEVDALYRPEGMPYRLGLSIKPQVLAPYQPAAGQPDAIAGRTLYSAAVAPSILSLGIAYREGEGAERFNRLAPLAHRAEGADSPEGPAGTLLLTGQLDLIQSAESAVPLRAMINQAPTPVAVSGALEPRIGLEHETLPGRLRLRAGAYLEPSAYASVSPRIHGTGGLEVRLFHALQDWSLSASFDVARLYYNFGLSLGVFRLP